MYRVMIIDDEPLVRIAIKSLVNWDTHGFDIQLEASHGKQALKLLAETPDIDLIVTDINMPIMDGIELLTELKEMNETIPVIALSGYNDYKLVRQAFKLGVEDYILKSEMTPDSLINTFNQVVSKRQKHSILDKKSKRANEDFEIMKERYLKDLLLVGEIEDQRYSFEELGIKLLLQGNIVVCQVLVDDYKHIVDKYTEHSLGMFMNSMNHSLQQGLKNRAKSEVVSIAADEYFLIVCFEEVSIAHIKRELNELLESIRYVVRNYINTSITVGVSNIYPGIGKIKCCADEAKAYANLRFILGKGRNIFAEDARDYNQVHNLARIDKEDKITKALKIMDKEKLEQELEQIFKYIYHLKLEHINQAYPFYMELIFIIGRYLNEIGEEELRGYIDDSDFYEKVITLETLEEISNYVKQIVFHLFDKLSRTIATKKNRTIIKALKFINTHYSNKKLSLVQVSDYVEVSTTHLSTLFSKEVHMNFKEYLTKVRIEKAKDLIHHTNLKMYEISEQVGYANVEHFSRVFKKITGSSPNHF